MDLDTTAFLQAAIGTILVLAAAAKASRRDPLRPFLLATGFSERTSGLVSRVAPPLEGLVGALLLAGLAFPAAAASAVLSLAFCSVLILARHRGVDEGCRCFGFLGSDRLSALAVVRAVLLAAGSLLLGWGHFRGGPAMWSELWRDPIVFVTILGAFAGAGYVLAFALLEQARNFERRRPRRIPARKGEVPPDTVVRNAPM